MQNLQRHCATWSMALFVRGFQEASIFPHLSVRANLEFGLRRTPIVDRKVKLEQVVEWMGLSHLIDRGDRAQFTSPRILLMDEPLSALDTASKQEILPYLEKLHRELKIPVLYVSQSLDEVARLDGYLVAIEKGRVNAKLQW